MNLATASFTVTPNEGYVIDSVTGCGGSLAKNNVYTTGPITFACTVTASFRIKTYLVTATAGSGGTISPSSQTVDHGATASFTVKPNSGYVVRLGHRLAANPARLNHPMCTGTVQGNQSLCGVASRFILYRLY